MYTHTKNLIMRGEQPGNARRAMILLHGRGATAEDILYLADELEVSGFALLAPQATHNSWYPYSFMTPVRQNEPSLSSALDLITDLVEDVFAAGISPEDLYFLGFSQGACLSAEYVARNPRPYGGVFILSGGLIGQELDLANYPGKFTETPVFIGCSDRDPHIPLERVRATARLFREWGASVTERIYAGMGHMVSDDEIEEINAIIKATPGSL